MSKKPIRIPAEKYQNLSGNSVVLQYKIVHDSVTVTYTDHSVYIYTNQSAGRLNVKKMKDLALAGKGLGTFIEANVKENFSRKIR
ncbi:MAG: hypothetical protein COX65_04955 [Elusimicrobia bacterium CG_4_10_14_0_2_um_filter_56_8]|nr:MAG: hypothetical protein AUJ51_07825 [Elusimicrobia bacterium CG1_02_56_21]PJA14868.1 MAG: hypothetical protein COX65_04955 [Elusimicrobia bacterium CG_4_10_14_0_2_um_filter_56_8]